MGYYYHKSNLAHPLSFSTSCAAQMTHCQSHTYRETLTTTVCTSVINHYFFKPTSLPQVHPENQQKMSKLVVMLTSGCTMT